jgi:hypothetical protein
MRLKSENHSLLLLRGNINISHGGMELKGIIPVLTIPIPHSQEKVIWKDFLKNPRLTHLLLHLNSIPPRKSKGGCSHIWVNCGGALDSRLH